MTDKERHGLEQQIIQLKHENAKLRKENRELRRRGERAEDRLVGLCQVAGGRHG